MYGRGQQRWRTVITLLICSIVNTSSTAARVVSFVSVVRVKPVDDGGL